MVYYNYRYYNPAIAKWLNRDPVEEKGGVNLYGCVNNNVINKIDLLGLICELHKKVLLPWSFIGAMPGPDANSAQHLILCHSFYVVYVRNVVEWYKCKCFGKCRNKFRRSKEVKSKLIRLSTRDPISLKEDFQVLGLLKVYMII